MADTVRYTVIFQAGGTLPADYVQPRSPGHPSVGDSPIRADFPDGAGGVRAYELAWKIWRAQNNDCRRTRAESDVSLRVLGEQLGLHRETVEDILSR